MREEMGIKTQASIHTQKGCGSRNGDGVIIMRTCAGGREGRDSKEKVQDK